MQTFTEQFYANKVTFVLGSRILFPVYDSPLWLMVNIITRLFFMNEITSKYH